MPAIARGTPFFGRRLNPVQVAAAAQKQARPVKHDRKTGRNQDREAGIGPPGTHRMTGTPAARHETLSTASGSMVSIDGAGHGTGGPPFSGCG
jgi:hypothetical protein